MKDLYPAGEAINGKEPFRRPVTPVFAYRPGLPRRMKFFGSRILPAFLICLTALGFLFGAGCKRSVRQSAEPAAQRERPELILYCGAGIRPAADKLISAFAAGHDARITVTYAGSGRLLGQLAASRRGDLFMPGSAFYVDEAVDRGLAAAESRRRVAYFVPVILVGRGNPLGITGLKDLVAKPLRLGLGDPRAVAVGRRAMKIFARNGYSEESVKANLVYHGGTVNELCMAVQMNQIDAAIVWDANARQFAKDTDIIPIPTGQNIVSTIPIVRLTSTRHPDLARKFIDFVVSPAGRKILAAEHYTLELK